MSVRGTGPALPEALSGTKLRVGLLGAILFLGLAGVFARAVHLQVVERDVLASRARDQYVRTMQLASRRGEILDRSGGTLASSVEVDSIWIDPQELAGSAELHDGLARLAAAAQLGKERTRRFLTRAEKPGTRFVWLRRRASPAVVAAVRELKLQGVGFAKEPRRFYPQKELAAHVLGFSGADGKGLEGLERALDEELRGRASSYAGLRDARGKALAEEEAAPVGERTGSNVTLTLDRSIQYLTEKALQKALVEHDAAAGTAVVLDPSTGEVLALASAPSFNPNVVPRKDQRDAIRNRAVTDSFEPGSTMKVFLLASALEAGTITEGSKVDCEKGAWRVGRHVINDHHGHGLMTPSEILKVSSNIGSGKIGLQLGGAKVAERYRDFGFGERSGLEVQGEVRGVVGNLKRDIETVTAAFGQGPITVTPIQLAAGMAAIANGGTLMKPHLVKRVQAPDGTVLVENGALPVRRVLSEAHAKTVAEWMVGVTEKGGTAEKAAIDGWPVAGKTGTAQKVAPGGGYGTARVASFAGFVPADAPRLVIVVVIDEPKGEVYGGLVAAPAFREIAEGSLKVLGVAPTRALTKKAPAKEPTAVVATAEPAAAEGWVDAPIDEVPGGVVVPDVRGHNARAAVRELAAVALEPSIEGSGRAASQVPPAGARVAPGTTVTVKLESM